MGSDAIGIDICPHPPHVIEADMHDLPFEDETFDFIFSNVFDHALYPEKKVSEIERVLKKGGKVVLHIQEEGTNSTPLDVYAETEVDNIYLDIITMFKISYCKRVNNIQYPQFITMNKELVLEKSHSNLNIEDVTPTAEYQKIWEEVNLPAQIRKASGHGLSTEAAQKCFTQLSRRPYYLSLLAKQYGCRTFAEVGTANGLQTFSFAEYLKENNIDGHVWTCDIIDVVNKEYQEKYKDYITFCLGDSSVLNQSVRHSGNSIDMFYIDGAHDYGDVIRDVYHLREVQSENPIWIFDDFDTRFGCYRDIQMLIENKDDVKIYRVGNAASGNPNHQVIVIGKY